MQVSSFSYYELNTNNIKTIQNQNFNSNKLCIHIMPLYKLKCFSRSQTPPYILTKMKLVKKLPKAYPPHGSSNNQKETKSHDFPCDSTINHKKTISHGSSCDSTINHKETISHSSPCDFTINHKETISHGAHDIKSMHHDQIMESYHSTYPFKQLPK